MRHVAAGTALALAAGIACLLRPPGVANLDNQALDTLTGWAGSGRLSGRVAIAEIDEASLARFGRWPWGRDLLATLVGRLFEFGASAVVLDMMFPEEDRASTGDDVFVKALSGKPVTIGYTFGFERRPLPSRGFGPPALPLAITGPEDDTEKLFFRATSVVCSVDSIAAAAAGNGFLNAAPDSDGIVRRLPVAIEYDSRHYPSLALAAVRVVLRASTSTLKTGAGGARELRVDGLTVPLEGPSLLRLRFRGARGSFPSVAAADVLENRITPAIVAGKIVLVGLSASGLEDMVATPAAPLIPGVELHATAIDNVLAGDFFSRPPAAQLWELGLVLAAAVGSVLLLELFQGTWGLAIAAAAVMAAWGGCALVLARTGVLISPLPASVAAACSYSVFTLFKYLSERGRADRTARQLVSERRLTEAALREKETRYQRLVENVNDAIVVHDANGQLVFANRRFREWFGLGGRDIREVCLEDYVAPEWLALVRGKHTRLVGGERIPGDVEFEGVRADGTRLWIEALISTVEEDNQITGTQSALRDITERKRIEAQYLQAQKSESLGRLAGGIAHDFNNLLTIINGYSDMLLSRPERDDEDREYLEQISRAGKRAAELTQKLLTFSRQQVAHPRALDLNAAVSEAASMYVRLIGEDIQLVTRLSPALGLVKADPVQVNQILINLVTNARDAMPQGGRLTIETKNLEVDEALAKEHAGLNSGSYVFLGVSDTGTGMDAEVQRHIFEPFFTTKPLGKGTGLGLATVHGIVRQSGGAVWVDSQPGKGAAFHICLPRIYGEMPAEDRPPETAGHPASAGDPERKTVLLVEDQDDVQVYSKTVLERQGYRVLQASNGPDAIAMAEKYPDRIHLLLTDVVLAQMSGLVLAEKLQRARPGIRVLFTSGYPAERDMRRLPDASANYLPKPFGPEALAAKVREVLGG